MGNDKKVIMINGDKSKWYEQAIFILKKSGEGNVPQDVIGEAERIINSYVSGKYIGEVKEEKLSYRQIPKKMNIKNEITENKYKNSNSISYVHLVLNTCIIMCCILLGAMLYVMFG